MAQMATAHTSDQVLQAACCSLVDDFGYHNVTILVYEPATDSLSIQANAGAYTSILSARPLSFPLSEGLVGLAANSRKAWLATDTGRVPRFFQLPGMDIRSEAVFPLIAGATLLGIFTIDSNQVDAFTAGDLDLLSLVSERIAMELERSRLIERLRQELQERERAESQARQSLSMLNAAFNSTADGLLLVNPQGRVAGFNQEFLKLWRIPPSLAERRDDDAMLAFALEQLSDPDRFLARVRELYAAPEEISSDVLEFKDGRVFERYSIPQRLEGEIVGRVWSFRDITARRQAEETEARLHKQLLRSQKMEALGTLAGGIAHDFNNLLAGIMGNADLLRSSGGRETERDRRLADILQACSRAKELIRGILKFSRREENHRRPVAPAEIVCEAAKLLRSSFPASLSIETDVSSQETWILADTGQLHQAIMNIGANAGYAMRGTNGLLRIVVSPVSEEQATRRFPQLRARPHVRIAISDTGEGISEAALGRIFDPFFTTKPFGDGTGMGLAIVHGIVQSNDGFINVESAPGKGTLLELYFPAIPRPAITPKAPPPAPVRGAGRRALVVDDEKLITRMSTQMLERLGFEVSSFNNPTEAWTALSQNPFHWDLLLTDLSMPSLSGLDLAERTHKANPCLPIILMTGYLSSLAQDQEKAAGIQGVLEKPFDAEALGAALRNALTAP